MNTNWDLIAKIAVPIVAAVLGAVIKDIVEKKSKLVSFVTHVSAFSVRNRDPNTPPLQVGTHITFVRNAGRKVANNVSVAHRVLPDYRIFPPIAYEERDIPGGGKEIFIPRLVPGEEISISYLYQSPLTASDIVGAVKSDEGFTKVLNVMLAPQWPKWKIRVAWSFIFIGVVASIYLFIEFLFLVKDSF